MAYLDGAPWRALLLCGSLILGCGAGDRPGDVSWAAPIVTREVGTELDFPVGRSLTELAIVGSELQIDNDADVPGAAHTGSSAATIGRDAKIGTLLSASDVAIGDGAHIRGDLRAANVLRTGTYAVDGVFAREAIPLRKLVRRALFATPNGPAIVGSATVTPGAYEALHAPPGSEIVLSTGSYSFEDLSIGENAKLTIDDRNGPVFVYVAKELTLNGSIQRRARLLLTYLGSNPVVLSRPFSGGVFAPNATIELHRVPAPHEGAFYGKRVHVHAGARVVHQAMPWVIGAVTFDRASACPGDSIHIKVDAPDPGNPAARANVAIDGAPVAEMFDQIVGAPGKHHYVVSATSADGTLESQLVALPVTSCATTQPARPTLIAAPHPFIPEAVALTVVNAPTFGDATYEWNFGDGSTMTGTNPAVTHSFVDAVPGGSQFGAFNTTVTVKRPGVADVSATRTFVVWSSYEISRARGMLEPPSAPLDPMLKANGANFTGELELTNREPEVLTYTQRRVDLIPCDGDAPIAYGGDESVAVAVPPKQAVRVPLSVPAGTYCGVVVHHFGATAAGLKAHVSVSLDRPSAPGKGKRVDENSAAMLNYLVAQGLIPAGRRVTSAELLELYRARKIPDEIPKTSKARSGDAPLPGERCDSDDPPPMPGFACQPTGEWESTGGKEGPLDDRIANAFKGDTVLVRGCGSILPKILGGTNPPQFFTHMGIMSKHRTELAHSTGDQDYLIKKQANGISAGLPSDGFNENGLRYLWPGTLVATVKEAFVTKRLLKTPEGETLGVANFGREEVRCTGDSKIIFPRVLKPTPGFEAATRTKLMAAADAATKIHGHYRFSVYSKAPVRPDPDPKGPAPIPNDPPRSDSYGPVPTVCSSFITFGLQAAGFELDRDKSFPLTSDVMPDTPDGFFFYTEAERLNAANALYDSLHFVVQNALADMGAEADRYWWASAKGITEGKAPDTNWPALGTLFLLGLPATGAMDTLASWATDAPDDVANQVANCFASDFCSTEAKDSDAWKHPGTGVAVSPDDMLNHYDSPATGGPYGYSERMIYRGLDLRPVYEWRPIEGTVAVPVRVVDIDGKPSELAKVTLPGFLTTPVMTDADGRVLIEGVPSGNIRVHAQKFFASPEPGLLREGDACYVAPKDASTLTHVDCADYGKVLDATPVSEALIQLKTPREDHRKVTIDALARLVDCDCFSDNDTHTHSIFEVCNVSPLERTQKVSMGKTALCVDEVGVDFTATCTLLPDDRTVRVVGKFELYEGLENSCGGGEKEDEKSFDVLVGPGATHRPFIKTLYHWDVCGFNACNDTAEIKDFTISNVVGD